MWTCSKCGQRIDDEFELCWSCGTTVDGVEDPHFLSDDVPTEPQLPKVPPEEIPEHLVTLRSCSLQAEAAAIRLQLEAAGIPVFLAEFTDTMDWLLTNAIGSGIKVQVAEADVRRACEVLGIELPQDEEVQDQDDDDDGPTEEDDD